jgi:hypothetical protein
MSKLDISQQGSRDILVFGELQSVVICYGVDLFPIMGDLLGKQCSAKTMGWEGSTRNRAEIESCTLIPPSQKIRENIKKLNL